MNIEKLKNAEQIFLSKYPAGFQEPELLEIAKKHKVEKMHDMALSFFERENFKNYELIADSMTKTVSRSSMVSVFEKPKFRDYVKSLDINEKTVLVKGLEDLLYGDEESGFTAMADILTPGKIAKWPVMTVCSAYFRPDKEVFVKPTTAKGIISFFEIDDIIYKPKPTYEFYSRYRDIINNMKKEVSEKLSPNNPAFSGFLMMSMDLI